MPAIVVAGALVGASAVTWPAPGAAISPLDQPSGYPSLVGPVAGESTRLVYAEFSALGNGQPNEPILRIGGGEQGGAELMEYDGSGRPVRLGIQPVTVAGYAEPYSLVGPMLTTSPDGDTVLWWNLHTHASGSAKVAGYAGSSADGWYFVHGDDIDDESADGVVNQVSAPFTTAHETIVSASVGSQGLVVAGSAGDMAYVTFGGVATPLDSAWRTHASKPGDYVVCGGTSTNQTLCIITGVDDDDNPFNLITERVPLDGAAPVSVPDECAGSGVGTPSVAFTPTAMFCASGLVTSQPLSADAATTTSSYSVGRNGYGAPQVVAALGTVVAANASQSRLETISDAATTPARLLVAPKSPVTAGDFALTTGRIAWTTDQPPHTDPTSTALSIRSRAISSDGGSLVTGKSSVTVHRPGWTGITASGRTTTFVTAATDGGDGYQPETVHVVSPERTTVLHHVVPTSLSISGNLVLFRTSSVETELGGHYHLLDAATGSVVPQAALNHAHTQNINLSPSQLWGPYVVYVSSGGEVRRLNVLNGKSVTAARSDPNLTGQLFEYGPYVSWRAGDKPNGLGHAYFRNVVTRTPPVRLPAKQIVSEMSDSGILSYNEDSLVYSLRGYRPTDPVNPIFTASAFDQVPQVSDGVLAWIDQAGILRAAALPGQHFTPLPLGEPYAPTRFTLNGKHAWRPSLPFSAGLRSCTIVIRRDRVIIRKLACSPAAMRAGVAIARWDGTNASGRRVTPGRYAWSVAVRGTSRTIKTENGSLTITH